MAESFIVASEFTVAAALWAHKSQIFKLDSAIVDKHGSAVGVMQTPAGFKLDPRSSWTCLVSKRELSNTCVNM